MLTWQGGIPGCLRSAVLCDILEHSLEISCKICQNIAIFLYAAQDLVLTDRMSFSKSTGKGLDSHADQTYAAYGTARHGTARHGTARHGTVR